MHRCRRRSPRLLEPWPACHFEQGRHWPATVSNGRANQAFVIGDVADEIQRRVIVQGTRGLSLAGRARRATASSGDSSLPPCPVAAWLP